MKLKIQIYIVDFLMDERISMPISFLESSHYYQNVTTANRNLVLVFNDIKQNINHKFHLTRYKGIEVRINF